MAEFQAHVAWQRILHGAQGRLAVPLVSGLRGLSGPCRLPADLLPHGVHIRFHRLAAAKTVKSYDRIRKLRLGARQPVKSYRAIRKLRRSGRQPVKPYKRMPFHRLAAVSIPCHYLLIISGSPPGGCSYVFVNSLGS